MPGFILHVLLPLHELGSLQFIADFLLYSSCISSLEEPQDVTTPCYIFIEPKDSKCADEYAVRLSNLLNTLLPLEILWNCVPPSSVKLRYKECPRSKGGFASGKTLASIEERRSVRLPANHDQYSTLPHMTRVLLMRDKERYIKSLADDVEGHLNPRPPACLPSPGEVPLRVLFPEQVASSYDT